ncbi:hypothetical protein [Mucilaginibacter sp.]|uniref:hypothetical protein n=1 Tax=Mucilaginibacter sp. TaxID=1882438 RepID=UPI003D0A7F4F
MDAEKGDALAFWKVYQTLMNSREVKKLADFPLVCRFCGRKEPEVTFKLIPHAVPELLGANKIIVGDECDQCNQLFSARESHLARFLGPYLTMGGVKGKKKVPQFESRTEPDNRATKTIIKSADPGKREVLLDSLEDYQIDHERKIMSLNFRVASVRPSQVYRALVKIGLSLLPESELPRYHNVFAWLQAPEKLVACFPALFLTLLTKKKFGAPYVELFQSQKTEAAGSYCPELTMTLGSGHTFLQIFLPEASDYDLTAMSSQNLSIEIFPGIMFDNNDHRTKLQFGYYDLSSNDAVTFDERLNFKFESGDFNIDPQST